MFWLVGICKKIQKMFEKLIFTRKFDFLVTFSYFENSEVKYIYYTISSIAHSNWWQKRCMCVCTVYRTLVTAEILCWMHQDSIVNERIIYRFSCMWQLLFITGRRDRFRNLRYTNTGPQSLRYPNAAEKKIPFAESFQAAKRIQRIGIPIGWDGASQDWKFYEIIFV